jgi:hypothetical protein
MFTGIVDGGSAAGSSSLQWREYLRLAFIVNGRPTR